VCSCQQRGEQPSHTEVALEPLASVWHEGACGQIGIKPVGSMVVTESTPQTLMSSHEFSLNMQRLERTINRYTSKSRALGGEINALRQQLGTVADQKRELDTLRHAAHALGFEASAIARLRTERGEEPTTSLLLSLLMQMRVPTEAQTTPPAKLTGGTRPAESSSELSLLPLLMMGSEDGGTGDDTLWLMLLMMFKP
jgi:hypothetical protein